MKLFRSIHGEALASYLERRWEYVRVSQSGSHIKLRTQTPSTQTVIVPAHKPMKVGTLQAILKDVAAHKGVSVAILVEDI